MANIIRFEEHYLVSVYGPNQEATRIAFGGKVYDLPTLGEGEFEELYDEAVDFGIALLETHEAKSLPAQAQGQSDYEQATKAHDEVLDALDVEYDRRERNRRRAAGPTSLVEIYG